MYHLVKQCSKIQNVRGSVVGKGRSSLCLCMMGPDRYNMHVILLKLHVHYVAVYPGHYSMWLLLTPHNTKKDPDVLGTIVLHTLSRYGNGD